jgi:hypothetical protein
VGDISPGLLILAGRKLFVRRMLFSRSILVAWRMLFSRSVLFARPMLSSASALFA